MGILNMKKPYLFLDRDGTLIREKHYLSCPDEVEIIPDSVNGLKNFIDAGFGLIIITNQSALARGIIDHKRLSEIHQYMFNLFLGYNISFDGIYYCPHHPDDGCDCRKPKPGLLYNAIRDFEVDMQNSLMIGDKPCDIQVGKQIGLCTILVRTGYGAEYEKRNYQEAHYIVDNINQLSEMLLMNHLFKK